MTGHEPETISIDHAARAAAHRARVAPHAEAWVRRRSRAEKHPVWDFLFTYYNFSPNKLMTWVPGILDQEITNGSWEWPDFEERDVRQAQWIATLCENVLNKPARLNCHGLHEWAMVYRQSAEEIRHNACALRLPPDELARFVESQSICCTHYDAFRFFTPSARPLNTLNPQLETRQEMEQPGCLHANMDLYKWAYKLWPWIGSDLVADAFEVAVAGREMDMRASPYDLAQYGFEPIRIETEQGRAEYRREQDRIARLAEPVRIKLLNSARGLVRMFGPVGFVAS